MMSFNPASAPARLEEKEARFAELARRASHCRLCPTMCGRTAVLSSRNGEVSARVMFIGEAPGRQGGDRTRIPFSGDQSGRNFQRFIASINLTREEIFITNAVLCNPRSTSGANRTPTKTEIANCSQFLQRQIEMIDPLVIGTLGAVSLAALRRIQYHQLNLKEDAGKVHEWQERLLVPLYHPSPQVLASHRREAAQLQDYQGLRCALRRAGLQSKRSKAFGRS